MVFVVRCGWRVVRRLVPVLMTMTWITSAAQAQQRNVVDTSAILEAETKQGPESMQQHVERLEMQVQELREQLNEMKTEMALRSAALETVSGHSTVDAASSSFAPAAGDSISKEDRTILDYFKGTTINGLMDGYYDYNFNNPIGRVNLLRAYDVLSNAFSLNQADLIVDHPPDISAGHRYGARIDLQFGQATSTLQGNPINEPRPNIYRNIFQVYGTYIVPVGGGLTVDFGKWASSLGEEGNYTQYQVNYSRSFWFDFLPFYHMGIRAAYQLNKKLSLNYWLVNGTNQTEPTNGFKDELFGLVVTPNQKISWTINYYFGQDHPDATPIASCGPVPVQPGLCFQQISPAPNGKTHILDSYATWQATAKLNLSAEGDYVIQRLWTSNGPGRSNAPADVWGGALYAKYQLTPRTYLAGRAEYLDDHGGLFTGVRDYIEALREVTATYDFQPGNGFDMRWEYRRDVSNRPLFLTDTQNVFSTHQDTATMGVIWWFGRKQGPW